MNNLAWVISAGLAAVAVICMLLIREERLRPARKEKRLGERAVRQGASTMSGRT
jgi:hypothetical protein